MFVTEISTRIEPFMTTTQNLLSLHYIRGILKMH